MTSEDIKVRIENEFMRLAKSRGLFGLTANSTANYNDVFSRAGVLSTLISAVAYVIALKEWLFEDWKKEIEMVAAQGHYGTEAWWQKAAKEWQFGDEIKVIDGCMAYENVDESKRIVSAVCVKSAGRSISICVAKGNVGSLEALSQNELTAFSAYVDKIQPLGVSIGTFSGKPAKVFIIAKVYAGSELGEEEIKKMVEGALNNYMAQLPFGGAIKVSAFYDLIMNIEGVRDVELTQISIDDGVKMMSEGKVVMREYSPMSGYAEISYDSNITIVSI